MFVMRIKRENELTALLWQEFSDHSKSSFKLLMLKPGLRDVRACACVCGCLHFKKKKKFESKLAVELCQAPLRTFERISATPSPSPPVLGAVDCVGKKAFFINGGSPMLIAQENTQPGSQWIFKVLRLFQRRTTGK